MLMFQASKDFQMQCFSVDVTDNDVGNEPDKKFTVIITDISNPAITVGSTNESFVTIIDDDGKQ